jgi:hypothetical protein
MNEGTSNKKQTLVRVIVLTPDTKPPSIEAAQKKIMKI